MIRRELGEAICLAMAIAFVVFFCTIAHGCKAVKPIVVTEYRDRVERDTLTRYDSVYISRWLTIKGDTVFRTDTIFKYLTLQDVREVYLHDSIPYEVEKPVYIRQRNAYDKTTARGFWLLLFIFVSVIGFRMVKRYYLHR